MKKTYTKIEEIEKDIKISYAKYFQTIERLTRSEQDLKNLLSDLSQKQEGASSRKDLIDVIRANCAYMNLLSLSRTYFEDIRSLKRFLEAVRNTITK